MEHLQHFDQIKPMNLYRRNQCVNRCNCFGHSYGQDHNARTSQIQLQALKAVRCSSTMRPESPCSRSVRRWRPWGPGMQTPAEAPSPTSLPRLRQRSACVTFAPRGCRATPLSALSAHADCRLHTSADARPPCHRRLTCTMTLHIYIFCCLHSCDVPAILSAIM